MSISHIVAHHGENPQNVGKPRHYNRTGTAGDPNAGHFMVVYLDVRESSVLDARFETYGCGVAVAVGSVLTQLIKGRSLDVARKIDASVITTCLGGLPLGKEHCAALAASALALALEDTGADHAEER